MEIEIAGLGNALVDALVPLNEDGVLGDLGLTRGHMHPVDNQRWQSVYDSIDTTKVQTQTGGSCANTIATLGLLGARAVFCGQVGNDAYGRLYAESFLETCGAHALRVSETGHTGKCLSMISTQDAERTLVTHLGAAVELPHVEEFIEHIEQARILHVTGYLLLGGPMRDAAWQAMEAAKEAKIPISLDVADPFVVNAAREDITRALEDYADLAFLNAEEATALTGLPPEEAVNAVGVATTVVKLGANGSLIRQGDEITRVGIHPATCIDTTGAGDAYAAGYLYGWVKGWSVPQCGDLGARMASLVVGQIGAVCREKATTREALGLAEAGSLA